MVLFLVFKTMFSMCFLLNDYVMKMLKIVSLILSNYLTQNFSR